MINNIFKLIIKSNIHSLYNLIGRVFQACLSLILIYFISTILDADIQGYYYTFLSLLAVQRFFELGLLNLIVQFTSHSRDKSIDLYRPASFDLTDSELVLLKPIYVFVIKWFFIGSILLFFLLIILGFFVFGSKEYNEQINWKFPWLIISLSTSLLLMVKSQISLLEGLGMLKTIYFCRMLANILEPLFILIFLLLKLELYSLAIGNLVITIALTIPLFLHRNILIKFISFKNVGINKNKIWREEIWPYQWRLAISTFAGYFIYQSLITIVFHFDSPLRAGQLGMTQNIVSGFTSISSILLTSNISKFSFLISSKEHIKFFKSIKKTVIFDGLMYLVLILFYLILLNYYLPQSLKQKQLSVSLSFVLFISGFFHLITSHFATILRCFKKENFLLNSIFTALTIIIFITFCVHLGFFELSLILYLFISLISLLWASTIFRKGLKQYSWIQY